MAARTQTANNATIAVVSATASTIQGSGLGSWVGYHVAIVSSTTGAQNQMRYAYASAGRTDVLKVTPAFEVVPAVNDDLVVAKNQANYDSDYGNDFKLLLKATEEWDMGATSYTIGNGTNHMAWGVYGQGLSQDTYMDVLNGSYLSIGASFDQESLGGWYYDSNNATATLGFQFLRVRASATLMMHNVNLGTVYAHAPLLAKNSYFTAYDVSFNNLMYDGARIKSYTYGKNLKFQGKGVSNDYVVVASGFGTFEGPTILSNSYGFHSSAKNETIKIEKYISVNNTIDVVANNSTAWEFHNPTWTNPKITWTQSTGQSMISEIFTLTGAVTTTAGDVIASALGVLTEGSAAARRNHLTVTVDASGGFTESVLKRHWASSTASTTYGPFVGRAWKYGYTPFEGALMFEGVTNLPIALGTDSEITQTTAASALLQSAVFSDETITNQGVWLVNASVLATVTVSSVASTLSIVHGTIRELYQASDGKTADYIMVNTSSVSGTPPLSTAVMKVAGASALRVISSHRYTYHIDAKNESLANAYDKQQAYFADTSTTEAWVSTARMRHVHLLEKQGTTYETAAYFSTGVFVTNRGAGTVDFMTADDGTTFTPPASYTFTLTGLKACTEVRVYDEATGAQLAGDESTFDTFSYQYNYTGSDVTVRIIIFHLEWNPIRLTGITLSNADQSIPIQQTIDRVFIGGTTTIPIVSLYAPMTSSLTLSYGTGVASFSRNTSADDASVIDVEGAIKYVDGNEARFKGARRVENLLTGSTEDFSNAAWTKDGVTATYGVEAPDGTFTATTITATGGGQQLYQTLTSVIGYKYLYSVWIKRRTGTGNINLNNGVAAASAVYVTDTWQRLTTGIVGTETNTLTYPILSITTTSDAIDIWHPMFEQVNGSPTGLLGIPSEYVSVGIGTSGELITNGDFANTGSGWTPVAGVSFLNNDAYCNASVGVFQHGTITAVPGKLYAISYECTAYTAGTLLFTFGGTSSPTSTSAGVKTCVLRATTNDGFQFTFGYNVGGIGRTVDNISIQEIDHGSNVDGVKYFDYHNTLVYKDNAVIGTGGRSTTELTPALSSWSFTNATLSGSTITKTDQTLTMKAYVDMTWTAGSLYEISYTVSGAQPDQVSNWYLNASGDYYGQEVTGNKVVKEVYFATTTVGLKPLYIWNDADVDGAVTITDISVVEITSAYNSIAQGATFGRRVENLLLELNNIALSTEDLRIGYTAYGSSSINSATSITFVGGSAGIVLSNNTTGLPAGDYVLSMEVESTDITDLNFGFYNAAADKVGTVDIAGLGRVRVATQQTLNSTASVIELWCTTTSSRSLTIYNMQIERVQDSVNQNPGEYVSVGVKTYPFNNTGFDGVKEYAVTNPNVVTSNIVTATADTALLTAGDKVTVEGTRTNLQRSSQVPSNATYWPTQTNLTGWYTTLNALGLVGYGMVANSTSGQHYFGNPNGAGATANATHAASIFASPYNKSWIKISLVDATEFKGANCYFNVVTGAVGTGAAAAGGGTFVGAYTERCIDGYRCTLLATIGNDTNYVVNYYAADADLDDVFAGDGLTANMYFVGAQVEVGNFSTSLIPTTTTAITRLDEFVTNDVANYSVTGTIAFEFTYNFDPTLLTVNAGLICFQADNSVVADTVEVYVDTNGKLNYSIYDGSVQQVSMTTTAALSEGRHKCVFAWAPNNCYLYVDGALVGFSESNTVPAAVDIDYYRIGCRETATSVYGFANATIGDIKQYNLPLCTDDALEASQI